MIEIRDLINYKTSSMDSMYLDSLITNRYARLSDPRNKALSYKRRKKSEKILDSIISMFKTKQEMLKQELGPHTFLLYVFTLERLLMDTDADMSGEFWNPIRDQNMAQRVGWLFEKLYPNQKIILWSASAHNARNMHLIQRNADNPYQYYNLNPYYQMGDYLHARYGEAYYSIFFTSGSGKYGLVFPDNHQCKKYEELIEIEKPKESSFEYLALKTNENKLFKNLRMFKDSSYWLNKKFIAYPFGHFEDFAPWKEISDGFFS